MMWIRWRRSASCAGYHCSAMRTASGTLERSWTGTPQEVVRERAAVLGRIAGVLESLLAELARLEEVAGAVAAEERDAVVREHAVVRAMALRYRWYLIVQREANGLYDEAEVERRYPIPPRCDRRGSAITVTR
jgi:hypothetical protein